MTYQRDESEAQRLDRNYNEQLQELRVAETGVQILFAFLLSIAFQQRFHSIDNVMRTIYVVTLICAAIAAALFIAPVAVHRGIFRKHRKDELVAYTAKLAAWGLAFLCLAMLGSICLIIDFVVGPLAAGIITGCGAVVFASLWWLMPMRLAGNLDRDDHDDSVAAGATASHSTVISP